MVALTLIGKWSTNNVAISVDGAAFGAGGAGALPTGFDATTFDIGAAGINAQLLGGDILWFACGTGTLTDADAAAIDAFGDVGPALQDLPGAPTLVWPADTSLAYAASEASVVAAWHQRRRSRRQPVGV